MPRVCSASTIWSLSAFFTRGSFAPWAMSKGEEILSAEKSGDAAVSKSFSVSGLPIISYCIWR